MSHLFFELTAILVGSALAGALMQWLKLPTILGYVLTGMAVARLGLIGPGGTEMLDGLAQIGIASLLFLVGLEMRLSELKEFGKAALWTGLGQIAVTAVVGYALCRALGFASVASLYVGLALTFSSTIIVIKLLTEKHAMETGYGRLVTGFLLVQDFVALGLLIFLSGLRGSSLALADLPLAELGMAFVKGSLLLAGAMAVGRHVLPPVLRWAAHSAELLFLMALAWGMGLAALAATPALGLTIEIGAFMAGLAMADNIERNHVTSRVRPLRDFFVVMFFVVLGSRVGLSDLAAVAWPVAALSLYVLVGNPLLMMAIMGALGYRARPIWLAGVTVAQVSEFSLIMMALGAKLGHVGPDAVATVTAVGIITIALSSYLIMSAERLYPAVEPFVRLFERRGAGAGEEAARKRRSGHVVLIGCHRMGHSILHALESGHRDFAVIDLDPEIVRTLADRGLHAVYGDITDPEIREAADFDRARLIICTVPDRHVAIHALRAARAENPKAKVVVAAQSEHDAQFFYHEGADYVALPHFMSGMHLAHVIQKDKALRSLPRMKKRDLALIDGTF
jgi:Kef-type K+ transport system membrane component KefB/uncharacterized UPF0146 family protein